MILAPLTMSGSLSATSQIATGPGRLHLVDIAIPATGSVAVDIYDTNASTSTNVTLLVHAVVTASATQTLHVESLPGRAFQQGIYAVLTGTGSYNVGYQK